MPLLTPPSERKILLIGEPSLCKEQRNLLRTKNCGHLVAGEITNDLSSANVERVVEKQKITDVVCIQTQNGQTAFIAMQLNEGKKLATPPVVYGINIREHPQNVRSRGLMYLKKISCVTEIV